MFRTLIAALTALCLAGPALAAGPDGQIQLSRDGLLGFKGFAPIVEMARESEASPFGALTEEVTRVGFKAEIQGFRMSATAGVFAFNYGLAGEGEGRIATLGVGYTARDIAGGALSLDVRRDFVYAIGAEEAAVQTQFRARWAMKF